jgi:hypothetical protein
VFSSARIELAPVWLHGRTRIPHKINQSLAAPFRHCLPLDYNAGMNANSVTTGSSWTTARTPKGWAG